MFGFLIKMILVAGLVVAVGFGFQELRQGHTGKFDLSTAISAIKSVNYGQIAGKIGQGLDSLVTHQGSSPVVLGIEITNESLKTIANTLSGLPPDQLEQIKQYICQPATPAAN